MFLKSVIIVTLALASAPLYSQRYEHEAMMRRFHRDMQRANPEYNESLVKIENVTRDKLGTVSLQGGIYADLSPIEKYGISSKSLANLSALVNLGELRELMLNNCSAISDISPVANLPLEKLSMINVPIGDEGVGLLRGPALKELDLAGAAITHVDFINTKNFPALRQLTIPKISSNLDHLFDIRSLRSISWGDKRFSRKPATIGFKAIDQFPELSKLVAREEAARPSARAGKQAVPPRAADQDDIRAVRGELGYGFQEVADKLVIVEQEEGVGSGFLAKDDGNTYIYTNQHVILGGQKLVFRTVAGQTLEYDDFEFSDSYDIARFRIPAKVDAFEFNDTFSINDPIVVFGNSGGGGVFTELLGRVVGIGADRVEISASIVQGNSGSAILDRDAKVVGIATYVTRQADNDDWVTKGTRFAEPRRFGLRIPSGHQWSRISWSAYQAVAAAMREEEAFLDQAVAISISWFNSPFANFPRSQYPKEFTSWIDRHNSSHGAYNRVSSRGAVRNRKDLERQNRNIRAALTQDYEFLLFYAPNLGRWINPYPIGERRWDNYLDAKDARDAIKFKCGGKSILFRVWVLIGKRLDWTEDIGNLQAATAGRFLS